MFFWCVRAKRLAEDDGRVIGVMTEDGVLEADEVVLAAGVAVNDLLAPFGQRLALDAPAGLLVHTEPVGEMLNGLVMGAAPACAADRRGAACGRYRFWRHGPGR